MTVDAFCVKHKQDHWRVKLCKQMIDSGRSVKDITRKTSLNNRMVTKVRLGLTIPLHKPLMCSKEPYWREEVEIFASIRPKYYTHELVGEELEIFNKLSAVN